MLRGHLLGRREKTSVSSTESAVFNRCCGSRGHRDEHEHWKSSRRGLGFFVGDLKQYSLIIPHQFGQLPNTSRIWAVNLHVLSKIMGILVDREAGRSYVQLTARSNGQADLSWIAKQNPMHVLSAP